MEHAISVRSGAKPFLGLAVALGAVTLLGGCATKKYVRTSVDTSAHELSARIDTNEQTIKQTQGQVEELNGVTREQGQKISTLDNGLKQTDTKAQQALTTGQTAQNAANKAAGQVATLETKFQNRNHYVVLNEEQVRFKFNSAKLDPSFEQVLDEVAQQLKQNPDTILVMEGHTDATGSDDYNIQLGQKRVQAVTRYLVVKHELPINRISDLSLGEDRPLADNKNRDGRAQNRAVVVRVMGPQMEGGSPGTVSQARPDEETDSR
ncbi:MAG: OmpA family protein [Acidobacteria bacterium]|nr:OmpA family protein [Acidobacteriota bacterium]